ncbi:MAG: phage tail length tape measure family protein, partial [Rhodospirillales bacterium]
MANRNISVRLQVDGGRFKAELVEAGRTGQQALKSIETAAQEAGAALEKTGASAQKADREQEKLARSAERLKRQYAQGYQATQEQGRATDLLGKGLLTQAEHASVLEGIGRKYLVANANARTFGQTVEQQGQRTRITAQQMAQLQPQLNDIFTTLTTGMSPLTIALQQGPQITQIFGGIGATFRAIPPVALGAAAALAAVGIPLGIILSRAFDLSAQSRTFNVALAAMGRQGQTTAEQLGELVEKLRDVGVARDEARTAIATLVRTPNLSAGEIPRLASMAPDLAAATGTTASDAARQLAEFATGGYDAIIKLDRALNGFLNPSQRENIRLLTQQGERTQAYRIAIDALQERIRGLNDQALSPTQTSLNEIGRAWDRLVDNLARGAVGRVTLQVVEGAISGAANLVAPSQPRVRDPLADAANALEQAVERLDRLNRETRLYRDPNAEVVIPGFSFGSPNAVRAQLQSQVDAARTELERQQQATDRAQVQAQAAATARVLAAPEPMRIGEETARQIADLERRQRVYDATPARRPIIEAEIQAETIARERNLNALEAEALKRRMVADAAAQQRQQYQDQSRELDIQSRATLAVADAYGQGQAAVIRAEAARQAALEGYRSGVDQASRAEEILRGRVVESAEAQARAAFQTELAAQSARRLAEAEAQGTAAVQRAEIAERSLAATRDARAALSLATGAAEEQLRTSIEATTRAIEAQAAAERARQLARERRTGSNDLDISEREAQAARLSDPSQRRAAELAIEREKRMQSMRERLGGVDSQILEAQDSAAAFREQARYFSEIRDQAKSLSSDISNFLVDGFANAGKAGKSVFSNLAEGAVGMFRRMAARIAATLIEQKFILPITSQIVGAFPSLFGVVAPQAAASAGASAAASTGPGFFESIGNW